MISRFRWMFLAGLLALASLLPQAGAGAASDLLPDLQMAPLRGLRFEQTPDGRRLLRFTSVIINTGEGPFEVHGQRRNPTTPTMGVKQVIFDDAGGSRVLDTAAVMYFAGDGHTHWHVRDLQHFELRPLDHGGTSTGAKHGFCFADGSEYDLTLPNAPQEPVYKFSGCGKEPHLQVTMGLSVGWVDVYPWNLPDQYIDITGLPSGRYRLWATADQSNWFKETDESNNTISVDITIDNSVKLYLPMVAEGPVK